MLASIAVADKPKTPPPPRRVQAPKVRTGRDAGGPRVPKIWLLGGAALALLLVAAVAGFVLLTGGDTVSYAEQCKYTSKRAAKSAVHVPAGTDVDYNTFPPTSGPHFNPPAVWGFYEDPVEPIRIVHNQEHGGITIWFGPQVPAATVARLRDFYNEDPNAMFGTELPALGKRIALTAWTGGEGEDDPGKGHVLMCTAFDLESLRTFRDEYRGKGPEKIPVEFNKPGSG